MPKKLNKEGLYLPNLRRKEERLSFPKPKIKERKEEDSLWDRFTYGIAPPNMSDMGPRDTGYMPYSTKWGFNRLMLIILLTCLCWTQTVPFVKTLVILYGPYFL